MAIDYARLAKTATRLLSPAPKGSGFALALRRKAVPGSFDPATQRVTGTVTEDLPTIGAWLSRSADYQVTGRGVGGVAKVSDINSQDRMLIIDASVEPTLDDKIVIYDSPTSLVMTPPPDFPDALEGADYVATIVASGGRPPYVWSVTGAPSWATITISDDTTTLTISGTAPVDTEMDIVAVTLSDTPQLWQILSEPKIIKPATIAIAYILATRK
jgi:hypothetical protein